VGLRRTGLGAALLIGGPIAAIVGFGLVGAGIANILPVLFSSTGRAGGGAAGFARRAGAGLHGLRPRRGGRAQTPPLRLDPSSVANDSIISRTI